MAESTVKQPKAPNTSEMISPDGTPIQQPNKPVAAPPAEQTQESPHDDKHVEIPDDENLSVMDFLNAAGKETKEEVKTEAKEEVKKEESVEQQRGRPAAPARDYSDIEPAHKQAFERMSNEAFNALKPMYLEHKQLKQKQAAIDTEIEKREARIKELQEGRIPENYYEHENAFVLTPEFTAATQNINAYNTVYDHWQSQLDAIRAGNADSYTEIHQDPRTGGFYLSAPKPVDKNTEKLLSSYTAFAQQKLIESQAEINLLAKSHKQRTGEAKGWIQNFETSAFKNFETNENLKALAKDTLSKMPATYRGNPLASAFAKALITIDQLGKLLTQLKANGGGKTANGTTAAPNGKPNANLTAAEIAGEGTRGKGTEEGEVTMDDFKRAKEGW